MNEIRFSSKAVCEVTGISPKVVDYRCRKIGIKTGGTGYTAEQVRSIINYGRKRKGTAVQLRAALGIN